MAQDRERKPVSSEELIKRAWENIGGPDSGAGSRDKDMSTSEAMTSSANTASTASSADRTLAAEEIARLLREEEQVRQPSGRPAEPPPRPRRTTPGDLPPPRPRRSAPIEAPPRPSPPPLPSPPPPRVPPRRDSPQGPPVPPARSSARSSRWVIFAVVSAVIALTSRFTGEISTDSNDVPGTLPATTRVLTPTTEPLSLESSTLIPESDLEPGMCIVWLPPGPNTMVATVPCTEPHQYEVIAVVDAAGPSSEYVSPDEVGNRGYDACLEEFPVYIGEPYVDSPWYLDTIVPTETEWVEEGDRSTSCLVYQPGGDEPLYLEGTARGSGSPSA